MIKFRNISKLLSGIAIVSIFNTNIVSAATSPDTLSKEKKGWIKFSSGWAFKRSNGTYANSWFKVNNTWYYFNQNGTMQTGWIKDNNRWYYLYPDGHMAVSETINGYKVGSDGSLI